MRAACQMCKIFVHSDFGATCSCFAFSVLRWRICLPIHCYKSEFLYHLCKLWTRESGELRVPRLDLLLGSGDWWRFANVIFLKHEFGFLCVEFGRHSSFFVIFCIRFDFILYYSFTWPLDLGPCNDGSTKKVSPTRECTRMQSLWYSVYRWG